MFEFDGFSILKYYKICRTFRNASKPIVNQMTNGRIRWPVINIYEGYSDVIENLSQWDFLNEGIPPFIVVLYVQPYEEHPSYYITDKMMSRLLRQSKVICVIITRVTLALL